MKACIYCDSSKVIRNGKYPIAIGKPVLRYRCKTCKKSFRSVPRECKQEKRGRPRTAFRTNVGRDSYSRILEDLILLYGYKLKLSFYKSGEVITGKSRPTLRRYIFKGSKNLTQDFIIKVFVTVKSELEFLNNDRLTLSNYKRLQTLANRIVKVSLGPPLTYIRQNTIIWNKKHPEYNEIMFKATCS